MAAGKNDSVHTPEEGATLTNFWLSWYNSTPLSEFELHSPWWVSGFDAEGNDTMVAAVRAVDEFAAFAQVRAAYDNDPGPLRERFIEVIGEKSPFSDRFPQAGWMAWDAERTCACDQHRNRDEVEGS